MKRYGIRRDLERERKRERPILNVYAADKRPIFDGAIGYCKQFG